MPRDLRVLVVDDDEPLRTVLCAFLEQQGCIVTSAGDGVDGLEAIRLDYPDVVIADLRMPRGDGHWLWREAVTLHPTLRGRFLFISGASRDPEMDGGAEEERFLLKPFTNTHFWTEVLATL